MNPAAPYVLGVWVTGWFIAARLICRWMSEGGPPDGEDRLAAGFGALFWPAIMVGLVLVLALLSPTARYPSLRVPRPRPRRAKRDARIAELERELGMRQ